MRAPARRWRSTSSRPTSRSDITAYESCYGISTPVSYSEVDGGPPPADANNGDGIETELDIEQVIGLAPKVNVIVYQGPNSNSNLPGAGPYDVYNAIISQDKAKVISTSWGICEPQDTPTPIAQQDENTLFQEAATQGESVFAAAGDAGSEDCTDSVGDPVPGLAAEDPASQPYVTGAGGTHLPSFTPPLNESVWNDPVTSLICADALGTPTACGGGGGISDLWPMPSYQSGAPPGLHVINSNSSGTPCGAPAGQFCREVPDVSGDADPATGYTIYWDGDGAPTDANAWIAGLGGTSGAVPLWAALMADVNASSACAGVPIGFANPVLYGTAANVYAGHFNDVTAGNNDDLGSSGGLYPAGPGYDMATGLGTPNATALAANLCAPAIGVSNPGPQSSTIGFPASVQITASDSSGRTLTFRATGLPAGLSINTASGLISGTLTRAGRYTVTVSAVNARGTFGSSTFVWTVAGLPSRSRSSLGDVGKRQPKLAFTLSAGTDAPALGQIVVSLPHPLSFSHSMRDLRRGITITQPGGHRLKVYELKLSSGQLTITFIRGKAQLTVTITSPAITASSALVNAVKHNHAGKLKLTLTATDTTGRTTSFSVPVKPT